MQAVRTTREAARVDFLDRNTMRCWDYSEIDDLFDDVLHVHFAGVTRAKYDRGPALRAK